MIQLPSDGTILRDPANPEFLAEWVAHYRRELERQGVSVDKLQEAVAWEKRDKHPYVRDFHREAVKGAAQPTPGDDLPGVVRRPPGRPAWTAATFHAAYREARDRLRPDATDKELAGEMHIALRWFQKLVRRFGRPA